MSLKEEFKFYVVWYGTATLILLLFGCFAWHVKSTTEATKEYSYYDTIDLDGCEYLIGYRKMAHKGNCRNPIHKKTSQE